ncbi:MMPL family transporter [Streptomyces sp. NPDC058700]|uniref:MMPL family transporter n=1 Tax=Streptomyces sp. NPDC058700 TaxID=3346607 RepID=UPI00365F5A49
MSAAQHSAARCILAATFAALTVMPLLYLAQIGCIVAVGVLIDTLLVRLFLDLGHRAWWPADMLKEPTAPQPFAPPGRDVPAGVAAQAGPVREI